MGEIVGSRYRIRSLLGSGGMGTVALAEDLARGGALVALKRVGAEEEHGPQDAAAADALIHEFETLARLRHPNLPAVHDFGRTDEGVVFLSMEYIEGRSLLDAAGALTADQALTIVAQICRALEFIHTRGLVHRDVKPENILVTRTASEDLRAVLVDFGLAAAAREAGSPRGTLQYVAPEILRGGRADRRADLYALGVVLHRLATGRCPFEGSPREVLKAHLHKAPTPPISVAPVEPAPLRPLLRDALSSAILRLLEKDPAKRYRSAAETLQALNRAAGSSHPIETAETGESYTSGAALVGRDKPLAALEALFDRLPQRVGGALSDRDVTLVLVAGEAGSGKTRLLLEAKRRAQVRGVLAATATCSAETPSFHPITEAIRLLGARAVPLQPDPGLPETSPERERLRAVDAAASSLAERASVSPSVILLDDAHHADEGTLAVCESLVRNITSSPGLALVMSFRPEETEGTPLEASLGRLRRLARTEEITLSPLSEEQTAGLLKEMLGLRETPRDLVDLICRETSGNPFFIEQAVRSLLEDGTISRVGVTFRADVDALTRISFPSGVGEAVGRRLARLPEHERGVLEALAVIARPAEDLLLGAACGVDPAALQADLADLEERRLVHRQRGDGGAVFAIANARTRESIYEATDWGRRRTLHGRVAEELRRRMDAGEPVRCEELARHVIQGSDPSEALPYALEAAERCRRFGASAEAKNFYQQALDLLPRAAHAERAEILRKIGFVEKELGRDVQALESFDLSLRAAGAAERRDLAAKARIERADVFLRRGRSDDALREIERALEILAAGGDRSLVARAYSFMASALGRGGKMDRALEVQSRALAAAEEAGEPAAVAAALNNLGFIHWVAGRREDGIATMERSIAIRREIADRTGEMETSSNLGMLLAGAGEYERAVPCLEKTAALARSLGDLRALVESQINLGVCRSAAGQHDLALPCFEEAAAVAIRIGDDVRASYALDAWGSTLRTIGDHDGAIQRHGEALERARRAGDAGQEAYAIAALALDHASASHLEEAREFLRRASRTAAKGVPARARMRQAEAAALTHLIAGAAKEAELAARDLVDAARAEHLPREEAKGLHLVGTALQAQGDAAAAATALEEAAAIAGRHRAEETRWRALSARAAVAEARGEAPAARAAWAEAAAILDRLAGRIAEEDVRQRYLSEPERSRLRETLATVSSAGSGPLRVPKGALDALYRISEVMTSATDLDALLSRVLNLAMEIVRAERGLIILVEEDGERQEVRAARGVEPETIADALEYSRSVVKEAAAGRVLIALDAEADRQLRRFKSVSLFQIKSLVCVPMKVRDRVLGTVYLDSRQASYIFRDEDVDFLKAFANMAASAIEMSRLNARLATENVSLQREMQDLRKAAGRRTRYQEIIGRTARMQAIYDILDRVSASNLPVLITGESGTGKELVARALHFGGPRKDRKFLSENVSAIPETLLESELFGHVRGAFTGADRDRKGVFELASGGTLFLDEIGDMPLLLQSKLLRALQEGEIRPVGGKDSIRVDVRVISATNHDLEAMLSEAKFREDLYYRLNVIRISMPPLRDRKEDVPLLVDHFLARAAETTGTPRRRLDISALQLLLRYDWPGNVRELENEVMKLVVLTTGEVITQQDLASNHDLMEKLTRIEVRAEEFQRLEEVEKVQIQRALAEAGGNRARAAQLLGISRATIYRKLKEYGISA